MGKSKILVTLYEHNKAAFNEFEKELENNKLIMIESCPGSGKSYITLKYLQEHPEETLVVCPKRAIAGEWEHYGEKYGLSISTMTYQKLCKLSEDEVLDLAERYPYIIYDECHHLGADKWGKNAEWLKQNCTDNVYIGLTATPIRYLDGRKDVGIDFFERNVVKSLSQAQAVTDGVLPGFTYVKGLFGSPEQLSELKKRAKGTDGFQGRLDEQLRRLEYCSENKTEVHEAFRRFMPDDERKGVVFVDRIDNLGEAGEILRSYFGDNEDYFTAHSRQAPAESAGVIDDFKRAPHGWLFVVDMLNEGLHIDGVNTIVMFRKTISPNVYIQQLGRSQASGGPKAVIFDFVGNSKALKALGTSEPSGDPTGNAVPLNPETRVIMDFRETEALQLFKELEDVINGPWSTEDVEFLTENYAGYGAVYCAEHLGKTKEECAEKASELGIHLRTPWTEESEQYLRENYHKLGPVECAKHLNISREKCVMQAHWFGLKAPEYWTDEEEKLLKEYFSELGAGGCAGLIGKTKSQCQSKAARMGLHFEAYRPKDKWTEEQTEFLRENYPRLGPAECARRLGITYHSCQNKAYREGLKVDKCRDGATQTRPEEATE